MLTSQHIEQVIETYCLAETVKDRATWLSLFAPGATHEDPVGAPVLLRKGQNPVLKRIHLGAYLPVCVHRYAKCQSGKIPGGSGEVPERLRRLFDA